MRALALALVVLSAGCGGQYDDSTMSTWDIPPQAELTVEGFHAFLEAEGDWAMGSVVQVEGHLRSDGNGTVLLTSEPGTGLPSEPEVAVLFDDPTTGERLAYPRLREETCIGQDVRIVGGVHELTGIWQGIGLTSIRFIETSNGDEERYCYIAPPLRRRLGNGMMR